MNFKRMDELEKIIKEKETSLRKAPKGSLRITHKGMNYQFYHMLDSSHPCGKYIRRSQASLANELAQKAYDEKVLAAAKKELSAWKTMKNKYPDIIPEDVFATFSSMRKQMIHPIKEPDERYIKRWEDKKYEPKSFQPEIDYYTNRNERVRSKSEILIANELDKAGIHYHYEQPLTLSDETTIYPDFTILDPQRRRELYWEHLGMMDDRNYCARALKRIELYEENGIFPGKELILTHETKTSPLNVKIVRKLISAFLQASAYSG